MRELGLIITLMTHSQIKISTNLCVRGQWVGLRGTQRWPKSAFEYLGVAIITMDVNDERFWVAGPQKI